MSTSDKICVHIVTCGVLATCLPVLFLMFLETVNQRSLTKAYDRLADFIASIILAP